MLQLTSLDSADLTGKRVLVRGDLDVDIKEGENPERLETLLPTLQKILEKGARQIVICGHKGRPEGKRAEELSLKPLTDYFSNKLSDEVEFVDNIENYFDSDLPAQAGKKVRLLENLRFWPGEKENSEDFAGKLSSWGDFYVNEAFGSSHRQHASIVGVPKVLPHAAGLRLSAEIEHLSKVLETPQRPLVFLISGIKEDKLKYIDVFKQTADKVLVGGRLPGLLGDEYKDPKVEVARLVQDKEDITIHSVEHFEGEVKRAKTVVVSGPMGKFEDPGHRQGTERVLRAVAESECYSVAGGGDTEEALSLLGLKDKFDWVSTGGGAMLEFLANKTLPGLEVLS